jgi:hypothetical protein
MHPRRGLLILETKDWKLETIRRATRQVWDIVPDGQPKVVINPLAQARHCAIHVVNALERDPQLVHPSGAHQGKLAFPWGHGVVFTRITRKQFEAAGLGDAIEPQYVICSDEMEKSGDVEEFQQRLWNMFPHAFGGVMSLPQLDRVRWIMFPLADPECRATLASKDCSRETPHLLDPTDPEDPGKLCFNNDGTVVPDPDLTDGQKESIALAIQYLGLWQSQLNVKRKSVWRSCERVIRRYKRINQKPTRFHLVMMCSAKSCACTRRSSD